MEEEIKSEVTEKIEEVHINNKSKIKLICILVAVVLIISGVVCYFVFIKGNDKKKTDTKKGNIIKDPKTVKARNDVLDYASLTAKVKKSKKNVLTKCDCSSVNDESNAEKSVCTDYLVSNDLFLSIVNKLEETTDAKELPTSTYCSIYSFVSTNSDDKIIFYGFTSNDLNSLLVAYDGEGYAFDYKKDLSSFFESIIASSDKIDAKATPFEADNVIKDKSIDGKVLNKVLKYDFRALVFENDNVTINSKTNLQILLEPLYAYFTNDIITKEEADKFFKDAYNFVPKKYENFICTLDNEPLLIYDEVKQIFYYNEEHPGHGGRTYGYDSYKVIDKSYVGDTYTISMVYYYGSNAEGYYINDVDFNIPEDDEEIHEEDFDEDVDYEKIAKEHENKHKEAFEKMTDFSKYPKYTFTFKIINNEPYLTSYKKTI